MAFGGCSHSSSGPTGDSPKVVRLKPGIFEDATSKAGINFRHTNGEPMRYPFLQTIGGGCAFLDYDQDGNQDILIVSPGDFEGADNGPNIALYHNNGNGTFSDATKGSGLDKPLGYAQAVAVGDYDNDGYPDVFIAGYGGCHLFHNVGKPDSQITSPATPKTQHPIPKTRPPQFEDVTTTAGVADQDQGPRWASGAVWGDYDGDGRLDLFVCHYAVWTPQTDKVCKQPDGSPMFCSPLVYAGDTGRLYHNEGGGRFKDATTSSGIGKLRGRQLAAAWIDYDGDGRDDLFVANDLDPNFLFHNNGNGTFTETALSASVAYGSDGAAYSGMGVAVGDYDRSGRESIFVPNLAGQVFALFRNAGGSTFEYATEQAGLDLATMADSGWGTAFLDFDRDGWPDLVTANGHVNPGLSTSGLLQYREPMGLYHNLGKGKFQDWSEQSGAMARLKSSRGLAIGDYDNDGRVDVLVVNRNDQVELFRNVNSDNNHWIMVSLIGTKGNRDAAGAKVWVNSAGARQFAECRLGSSYASSNDKRMFFGLGGATRVDSLQILWPGGKKEAFQSLAADRFYTITEGKGPVAR